MDVLWTPLEYPGLEHLRVTQTDVGVMADGLIVGRDDEPFRLHYSVECDSAWRVLSVHLDPLDGRDPISLVADGAGTWQSADGAPLPELDGCIDIDISASPFTNTLPVRRLRGVSGYEEEITVVYIPVPDLTPRPFKQRYTLLDQQQDRATWRYKSVDSGFTADITVDLDGLVLDYPGLFRRV